LREGEDDNTRVFEFSDADAFVQSMKWCVVEKTTFASFNADETFLDTLAAVRSAWINGDVSAPRGFTNDDAYSTAFEPVLLSKSLRYKPVGLNDRDPQFFARRALRRCKELEMKFYQSVPLDQVTEWLHLATEWNEPKVLTLNTFVLDATPLVHHLVGWFRDSCMNLTICGRDPDVRANRHINDRTSEKMVIDIQPFYSKVVIERKRLE
ncbi:hypothetical protein AAVH_33450, partial [Aphelenchoides avenae]